MSKVHFHEVLLCALATTQAACKSPSSGPDFSGPTTATGAVPEPRLGELIGPLQIAAGDVQVRLSMLAAEPGRLLTFRGSERNIPTSFAVDPQAQAQAASAASTLGEHRAWHLSRPC